MTTPAVEQSLLFTPITIGRMEIKNRIIMPAMILNYPVDGFDLSPKWYHFYRRAARGGSGLIICGATFVDRVGKQDDHQLGADCDDWLPALTKVAEVIHENGAKAALQLNHAGRYSWKSVTGSDPVAPSPIYTRYTKLVPKELTTTEVEGVLRAFADAALRAKKAGFDAVELLGATGYLISQFMSPLTNIRTDRFGGDFEGRLTFVKELIQGIKAATGNDFPLIFRHSSTDNMPGGLDASDQRRVAVKLAEWGVDMLNVTAGWHDSPVHQIGPSVPHGYFVPLATKIKAEVNIPVSCAFRITEPELARELVDKDKLDMVTMCRALLADPDWPAKAQALKDGAIRRCICCCHCFDEAFKRAEMDCAINPELGKPDLSPTAHPKHILVVGAGPGGLEAARVLTLRGHAVTLIESGDAIGGKLEMGVRRSSQGRISQSYSLLSVYDRRSGNQMFDLDPFSRHPQRKNRWRGRGERLTGTTFFHQRRIVHRHTYGQRCVGERCLAARTCRYSGVLVWLVVKLRICLWKKGLRSHWWTWLQSLLKIWGRH